MDDLHKFMKAVAFATQAHEGQTRNDGTPYILHPLKIATMLATEYEWYYVDVLCIAVLHDVVEDCAPKGDDGVNKMFARLYHEFGDVVASGVATLSKNMTLKDDKGNVDIDKYFKYISGSMSYLRAVKIADRIHNLSDMKGWKNERKLRYIEETKKYIIPMAISTDSRMHDKLVEIIRAQETLLQSSSGPDHHPPKK